MELWIRSQDKEKLVLTKGFETQHTNYDGGCQIFAVWENNYQMVGKYKSKERALEVLDEIQNMIKPTLINTEYHSEIKQGVNNLEFDVVMQPVEGKITYIQPNVVVYEMPKE